MSCVLVVEDRETDRERLVTLLTQSGYQVIECDNGHEALRLTREHKPSLVIADMLVPEMDGLDLARGVRSDPEIAVTPIIIYTATYEKWQVQRLARAAGVARVIEKPADPKEILAAVAEFDPPGEELPASSRAAESRS